MAKRSGIQDTSNVNTRSFNKGMVKDLNESLLPPGAYTSARNAVNNSKSGEIGVVGNEPSNELCTRAPYDIIGAVFLYSDKWVIFSTNNTDSEIGIFDDSSCSYTKVINDKCLNFSTYYLITGQSKQNFDCSWQVYWADSNNPDRTLNLDNIPYIGSDQPIDPLDPTCFHFVPNFPLQLDCEKIRLAPIVVMPCLKLSKGISGGELLNGTYYVTGAYTTNEQRVTDYFSISNSQPLFTHEDSSGSLQIEIAEMDTNFYDEFELVVIRVVNNQTTAKQIGIYSTREKFISLDIIDETLPTVPLQFIPIQSVAYDKSEAIYRNGEYLIRVAPTGKFDFNYQPLANKINAKWLSVEYPVAYYKKGGNKTSYLRDEQYAFFIRWVYNTGDKSSSYHIPGRVGTVGELATAPVTSDAIEYSLGFTPAVWQVQNTAGFTPLIGPFQGTDDGGFIIAEGDMGYWESTEKYPDENPTIWDTLCGKNIRHHKFPDQGVGVSHLAHHSPSGIALVGQEVIRILGVKFENIEPPIDNTGNPIPGIVGYEILRASREGNKTIVGKGIINNTGTYTSDGVTSISNINYQNYPFNDLRVDPFLSNTKTKNICSTTGENYTPLGNFRRDLFTFHSPDTQFRNPFLAAKEIKVYGELYGTANCGFRESDQHPMHKIVNNLTFTVAAIAGLGLATLAIQGETKKTVTRNTIPGYSVAGSSVGIPPAPAPIPMIPPFDGASPTLADAIQIPITQTAGDIASTAAELVRYTSMPEMLRLVTGQSIDDTGILPTLPQSQVGYFNTAAIGSFWKDGDTLIEYYPDGKTGLYGLFKTINAIPTLSYYWSEGANTILELIRNLLQYKQHAMVQEAHCYYNNFTNSASGTRRLIEDSNYLKPQIQDFDGFRINNLYRGSSVIVKLATGPTIPDPVVVDNTRVTIGQLGFWDTPTQKFTRTSSCKYVGLKHFLRNQYGQLDGLRQVLTGSCIQRFTQQDYEDNGPNTTDPIFGGDTYVTRYTEKNTFFYFYDWMYGQPDGYEFDYLTRKMVAWPRYWMDTRDFDASSFVSGLLSLSFLSGSPSILPSNFHALDRDPASCGLSFSSIAQGKSLFQVEDAYMYLFNSGVRDFYIESEVNTEFRDWEDSQEKRHYDPYEYTGLNDLFNTKIIKSGNFFKYNYSLSASKQFTQFTSWGNMQLRNYDPIVAEKCYTYYPKRLIYSLPQNKELRRDNWKAFLINNYKDFGSRIISIKSIGMNGAVMLFETQAPIQIQGVDTLQTDGGVKVTIGDGGLFSQPLRNVVNADDAFEYGSCQDRLSVTNTPAGLFWICQNQGKIFSLDEPPREISQEGMKWWFEEFLPYKILEDFPNFELTNNPVAGVGCQSIYDSDNTVMYFTKKDYKVKDGIELTYLEKDYFIMRGGVKVKLGDPRYFNDASWTLSYDPKSQSWISFHDWHPDLVLPSKNNFITIKNNGIWKHNDRCDSYCNFYGTDYPFEVCFPLPTGQNVEILRSVEYQMEVYKRNDQCTTSFHVLDFNFDKAVVYNSEQVSGYLNLNIKPKNNVTELVSYPRYNFNSIDILYSKEEQKYRFNQFLDITDDRGEFSGFTRQMWLLEPNGYIRTINPLYVNYSKDPFQRKKFRHYSNGIWLQRRVSGDKKMLLKLLNDKNLISLR